MRHRPVVVLLEQKRTELGEDRVTFWRRLFDLKFDWAVKSVAEDLTLFRKDFPERKLPIAAELLGIPVETLRTI